MKNNIVTIFKPKIGNKFRTQREIEYQSLSRTIEHFKSSADTEKLSEMMFEHWRKPPIFPESKKFMETCPIPVYIVSNIDKEDILEAVRFKGIKSANIFTSEDAHSYKPRKELFEYALRSVGIEPGQVVHIGDSLESDVKGARSAGINAVWVNRRHRDVPENVTSVVSLSEILGIILNKM